MITFLFLIFSITATTITTKRGNKKPIFLLVDNPLKNGKGFSQKWVNYYSKTCLSTSLCSYLLICQDSFFVVVRVCSNFIIHNEQTLPRGGPPLFQLFLSISKPWIFPYFQERELFHLSFQIFSCWIELMDG